MLIRMLSPFSMSKTRFVDDVLACDRSHHQQD